MEQKTTTMDECRERLREAAIEDLAGIVRIEDLEDDADLSSEEQDRYFRNLTHRWIWWETDIGLPLVLGLRAHEEQLKENLDDMEFVCEADANFTVEDLDRIIEERNGTWLYN